MAVTLRVKNLDLSKVKPDFERRKTMAQLAFGTAVLNDSNRYIPQKTGDLRASGRTENGGKQVVWESYSNRGYPYGAKQYRTQYSRYTTPGTGPRWEKKAEGLHMSKWESEVGRYFA